MTSMLGESSCKDKWGKLIGISLNTYKFIIRLIK